MNDRVRLLVEHGADVTLPFDDGTIPAAVAATTGHRDLVDYLVAHGSPALDLEPVDDFIAAALAADRAKVDQLLAEGRIDVPSEDPWETALHKAAESRDTDLARMLLRLGADPDIRDKRFGSTPLGWARHFGREQLIELLEPVTTPDEATG